MPTPPLPEPGEEVVQQSRVAVIRMPEVRSRSCFGHLSQQLIAHLKYTQSRVLNAMDNLMNVVVGAVVDASVYAFTAQAVIFLLASLDVIFNANLFHLPFWKWHNKQAIRTKTYALSCFVLRSCPHGHRHFDVAGLLFLHKGDRVALCMVAVVQWSTCSSWSCSLMSCKFSSTVLFAIVK